MDEISKLGFLAAEVLLSDFGKSTYYDEDVSIILSKLTFHTYNRSRTSAYRG